MYKILINSRYLAEDNEWVDPGFSLNYGRRYFT